MKDRAEAGFAVGEISLAMQVLRAAIRRALNGAIKGCGADDRVELKNLHAEILRMRHEEPRQLQSQKEKYDKLLIQARQEGRTEKELEAFYEVGSQVIPFKAEPPLVRLGLQLAFFCHAGKDQLML